MDTVETTPLRYHGYSSKYVDIATRGADEHLGFSIVYAPHSEQLGCFVVRFVAHGKGVTPEGFTHLTYREPGVYKTFGEHAKGFKGVRLNKFAIKAFSPAIFPHELAQYLDQFNLLPLLEEWIAEQMLAEGFTVTVDLAKEIRSELIPEPVVPPATAGPVTSVLAFPNLVEAKKPAKPVLTLVEPTDDEEDEEAEEDDASEDDSDEKDWLQ